MQDLSRTATLKWYIWEGKVCGWVLCQHVELCSVSTDLGPRFWEETGRAGADGRGRGDGGGGLAG